VFFISIDSAYNVALKMLVKIRSIAINDNRFLDEILNNTTMKHTLSYFPQSPTRHCSSRTSPLRSDDGLHIWQRSKFNESKIKQCKR